MRSSLCARSSGPSHKSVRWGQSASRIISQPRDRPCTLVQRRWSLASSIFVPGRRTRRYRDGTIMGEGTAQPIWSFVRGVDNRWLRSKRRLRRLVSSVAIGADAGLSSVTETAPNFDLEMFRAQRRRTNRTLEAHGRRSIGHAETPSRAGTAASLATTVATTIWSSMSPMRPPAVDARADGRDVGVGSIDGSRSSATSTAPVLDRRGARWTNRTRRTADGAAGRRFAERNPASATLRMGVLVGIAPSNEETPTWATRFSWPLGQSVDNETTCCVICSSLHDVHHHFDRFLAAVRGVGHAVVTEPMI